MCPCSEARIGTKVPGARGATLLNLLFQRVLGMAQDDNAGEHGTRQHKKSKVASRRDILISNDISEEPQAGASGAECKIKRLDRWPRNAKQHDQHG